MGQAQAGLGQQLGGLYGQLGQLGQAQAGLGAGLGQLGATQANIYGQLGALSGEQARQAGIQCRRNKSPIGVPGPVCVKRSFSSRVSIVLPLFCCRRRRLVTECFHYSADYPRERCVSIGISTLPANVLHEALGSRTHVNLIIS